MTKTFCDRCGAEGKVEVLELYRLVSHGVDPSKVRLKTLDVCQPCESAIRHQMEPLAMMTARVSNEPPNQ